MAKKKKRESDMIDLIDFQISFCEGKKEDNGEDSEKHVLTERSALIGVFDGCGGAGARVYENLSNKTGAYIASRAVADAFEDWFEEGSGSQEKLVEKLTEYLRICESLSGAKDQLIGMISKKLPTTAAAAVLTAGTQVVDTDLYWAGDSRLYLLDQDGLAQLTEDDLGGIDAFDNLSEDGVLTNMINLSTDFSIHHGRYTVRRPSIVFAATDGCFGYLPSPMAFEYLLLSTLMNSRSVEEWEQTLVHEIGEIAGDDYSISGISMGFGSLDNLKKTLMPRMDYVYRTYIEGSEEKDRDRLLEEWQTYRTSYHRALIRGVQA